jgi:hypothetical protein
MPLIPEVWWRSLPKYGEELCGDKVEVVYTPETTIVVLSDGLGSGVKANILATLTTRIASGMLKRDIPLEAVVETVLQTLPVCKVRKMAYSTLAILQIDRFGRSRLIEIDTPRVQVIRHSKVRELPFVQKCIHGKEVLDSHFTITHEDVLVMVSDGVILAGIGGILPLGWGVHGLAEYLRDNVNASMSTMDIVDQIINRSECYYAAKPGDDTTVIAVKMREERRVKLLTGPPEDPALDEIVVKQFMYGPYTKVVAGGTTASIVARILERKLITFLEYEDADVPPVGKIAGIDLVCEGMLTLQKTLEKLQKAKHGALLTNKNDGATRLTKILLGSDEICIMAGKAINPAHQNPDIPYQLGIRNQVVDKIAAYLTEIGKRLTIEWY